MQKKTATTRRWQTGPWSHGPQSVFACFQPNAGTVQSASATGGNSLSSQGSNRLISKSSVCPGCATRPQGTSSGTIASKAPKERPMMRSFLALLSILFVSISCSNPSSSYATYVYTPRFGLYSFVLNGKYRISHEYLAFNETGQPRMGGCSYSYGNSNIESEKKFLYLAGDMFEHDGHVFQTEIRDNKLVNEDMDRYVLGRPYTSRLGGGKDANGKPLPVILNQMTYFKPICHDRIGGVSYSIT
jgi:hypothetical protein